MCLFVVVVVYCCCLQVESSQKLIRIIGLSATLPNYYDVARFLCVNLHSGLFVFDERFRAVPLSQTFVGVKTLNKLQQLKDMDNVCYEKCYDYVRKGHQVINNNNNNNNNNGVLYASIR